MTAALLSQPASQRNKNSAIPTNLTLSRDARKCGAALKKIMRRPSLSNVVETLILEKHAAVTAPKAKELVSAEGSPVARTA